MCTMNCRVLLFTSMILLLAGCGQTFYINLPDNHLSFPAEGGSVEYVIHENRSLLLDSFSIDGEYQKPLPLYADSKIIGEYSEWISFIYGRKEGNDVNHKRNDGIYTIEVKLNPTVKSRSAVLRFYFEKEYGEIYVYQEGRSE